MRYILLGTGSPHVSDVRAGSAHLAIIGDDALLFDCGPVATHRFKRTGVPFEQASAVFLTHHHYDHCADLGHFALARWDHSATLAPLDVYGPPGTHQMVTALFGPGGVWQADNNARTQHPLSQRVFQLRGGVLPRPRPDVRGHDVPHGLVAETAHWRVLAGPTVHAQPVIECYSYRLETADRSIVFSGDTGYCPELGIFARGADTLVHMCCFPDDIVESYDWHGGVSGPSDAGKVAAIAGVRKLVLTHPQGQTLDTPEGMADAIVRAGRYFKGEIVFAHDLLEV